MQRLQDELAKFLVFTNCCSSDASEPVELPTNVVRTGLDCDEISSIAAATRVEDLAQRAHDLTDEDFNVQVDEIINLYSPSSSTGSTTSPPSTTPSSIGTSLNENLRTINEGTPDLGDIHRLVLDESSMLREAYQNILNELEKLKEVLFSDGRQHAMTRERNLANFDLAQSASALTTTWLDDALYAKEQEQLEERPDDAVKQPDEWRKCKEMSELEYGRLWDKHQKALEELTAERKWKKEADQQYGYLLHKHQRTMSVVAKIEHALGDKPQEMMSVMAKIDDALEHWRCAVAGPQP